MPLPLLYHKIWQLIDLKDVCCHVNVHTTSVRPTITIGASLILDIHIIVN